jgi:hypothetical protein
MRGEVNKTVFNTPELNILSSHLQKKSCRKDNDSAYRLYTDSVSQFSREST